MRAPSSRNRDTGAAARQIDGTPGRHYVQSRIVPVVGQFRRLLRGHWQCRARQSRLPSTASHPPGVPASVPGAWWYHGHGVS